jgi:glycosyltransferase involved in cell wall biosynthesis
VKIFGWLADMSGCGYYRLMLPGAELVKRGHDVMLDGTLPTAVQNGECDVIVGQRTCLEGASFTWQKLARAGHTKLVFETDDLLSEVDPSNRHAARFYDFDMVRRYRENMAVADVITVTTDRLAEHAREVNRTAAIHVLPNQIPAWMLEHERPSGSDLVTIGWRGGKSHDRDFGELARPLRRFLQHPSFRDRAEFHAMGAEYHERVRSNHSRLRWTGWHESVTEFLRAVDFDLAVIPLRPTPFNDCKSDLALVEMSALGVPAVVSDTGPYGRAVADGAPCRLATTAKDWTAALTELVNDNEAREQLGKQAREWAAGRTIEGNAWRWEEAYSS